MQNIAFSCPYFDQDEIQSLSDVIRSNWVTGGAKLRDFEERFAKLCGAPYAVGVSSWTTGAFLVLKAMGIGPGDEVLVPSLTFIASVNVIVHAGATPIFVDIDPNTWNIDPNLIEEKITKKTKLILPVDQIGLPCDIDKINNIAAKYHIPVLQDAACSFQSFHHKRPVGSLCETSIFSLHARKVITTGEGGMIVTRNETLAKQLKRLRHQGMSLSDFERHGASPTLFETYPEVGYNFRITDLQAAVGLAQLEKLEKILTRRREIAETYLAYLQNHPLFCPPYIPAGMTPNWQSYQIKVKDNKTLTRNKIMELLHEAKIPTRRGVMASHLEAPYLNTKHHLPHTEYAALNTMQLPMHPGLTSEQQHYIINILQKLTETAGKA